MQHSRLTLAFKPLISLPSTLYLLPVHPHHRLLLLAVSLHLLLPLSLLTTSGFFNGILAVFEPGALNYYTLFRLIPLTLFVSRNLTSIHLPLSGFLDSLLCDLIAATPRRAFSLLMPSTLAAASSFSSVRAHPSRNFLPPLSLYLLLRLRRDQHLSKRLSSHSLMLILPYSLFSDG